MVAANRDIPMMNNYLPMYDIVGYRVSEEEATVAQDTAKESDKYAKLLQIQVDKSSVYQEPEHNHSSSARKSVQKLKTSLIIMSLVVIFLLVVVIVGIALTTTVLRKCNFSQDQLHQMKTENCKSDIINCSMHPNESSCQTDPPIHLPVSKRRREEHTQY